MVVLDPVWNLKALQSHQGASIHQVLMALPSKLLTEDAREGSPAPHPLSHAQPSVEHALVCIVEAVAGVDAARHLNEFLDDFAPFIRIPRLAEFD